MTLFCLLNSRHIRSKLLWTSQVLSLNQYFSLLRVHIIQFDWISVTYNPGSSNLSPVAKKADVGLCELSNQSNG